MTMKSHRPLTLVFVFALLVVGCKKDDDANSGMETRNYRITDSLHRFSSYHIDSLGTYHSTTLDSNFSLSRIDQVMGNNLGGTFSYLIFRGDTFTTSSSTPGAYGCIAPKHSSALFMQIRLPADSIIISGQIDLRQTSQESFALRGIRQ